MQPPNDEHLIWTMKVKQRPMESKPAIDVERHDDSNLLMDNDHEHESVPAIDSDSDVDEEATDDEQELFQDIEDLKVDILASTYSSDEDDNVDISDVGLMMVNPPLT